MCFKLDSKIKMDKYISENLGSPPLSAFWSDNKKVGEGKTTKGSVLLKFQAAPIAFSLSPKLCARTKCSFS